ncbi:MAG: CPBP family intramembrane metalloprotease [Bacteroidales bacterium]|nr:CPBP family intramembrane metalloprotease [Bacteroidales bacterium]
MKTTIKLVIYYFLYQLVFSIVFMFFYAIGYVMGGMKANKDFGNGSDYVFDYDAFMDGHMYAMIALAMIVAGIVMIWHLIHFKYVKFNLKSFCEVPGKTILLSIPLIFAVMTFSNLCCEFLNVTDMMQDAFIQMSNSVFGVIAIAIMAPLVEELLFRGAIEGHFLRKGTKPVYAILISAAVFGIVHMNPAQMLFGFLIGLIFGWLYYRTGSVVPGMIGHFINNGLSCIVMATSTPEELNTKTIELWGATTTYTVFALSLVVFVALFIYMKNKLPKAPEYTSEA